MNGVFSDWLEVPAGVPQGNHWGPWLFLAMVNDLRLPKGCGNSPMTQRSQKLFLPPSTALYKKRLISFVIGPKKTICNLIQSSANEEVRTCFNRTPPCFSQVAIEGIEFKLVSSAKVPGVVVSSDLKWSAHIDSITTKAVKRLYLLRQLKRAGIAHSDLVSFYCSVIRSILEYTCQVFHCNLPLYLGRN